VFCDVDCDITSWPCTASLRGTARPITTNALMSSELIECISMHAMRDRDISDILTHDDHFRQEGFRILL